MAIFYRGQVIKVSILHWGEQKWRLGTRNGSSAFRINGKECFTFSLSKPRKTEEVGGMADL